jgi:hypothetical protein
MTTFYLLLVRTEISNEMNQCMFKKVETRFDLERCYVVLKELRKKLTIDEYFSTYEIAHSKENYEIIFLEENETLLAIMGLSHLHDFVHGRHL